MHAIILTAILASTVLVWLAARIYREARAARLRETAQEPILRYPVRVVEGRQFERVPHDGPESRCAPCCSDCATRGKRCGVCLCQGCIALGSGYYREILREARTGDGIEGECLHVPTPWIVRVKSWLPQADPCKGCRAEECSMGCAGARK